MSRDIGVSRAEVLQLVEHKIRMARVEWEIERAQERGQLLRGAALALWGVMLVRMVCRGRRDR